MKRFLLAAFLLLLVFAGASIFSPPNVQSTLPARVITIVSSVGTNIVTGTASALSALPSEVVQVVNSSNQIMDTIGNLPAAGNLCNMLFDNGSAFISLTPGGDLVCGGTLGQLTLAGQEGIPYNGSALSPTVAGQFRGTTSSDTMIVYTLSPSVVLSVSGSPTTAMAVPTQVPQAVNFNNNFASSTGVSAASCSCGSNPSEDDTWTIKVAGSTVGQFCLNTSCAATFCTGASCSSSSCTFSGGSGSGFSVSANSRWEFDAPGTVSGANISCSFPAHY